GVTGNHAGSPLAGPPRVARDGEPASRLPFVPGPLPGIQPGLGHRVQVFFVGLPNVCRTRLAHECGSGNKVAVTADDSEVSGDTTARLRMLSRVREVVAEVDMLAACFTAANVVVAGRLHVGPGFITYKVEPGAPDFPCTLAAPFPLRVAHHREPVGVAGRRQ